jgi:MarR family transcriptional regulator, 2-MHQ and catechol-resistance regulon repressor
MALHGATRKTGGSRAVIEVKVGVVPLERNWSMERKLRIAQYGCGQMSVYTMRYAMEKGADIVCAFGRSHNLGKDIGDIAGVAATLDSRHRARLWLSLTTMSQARKQQVESPQNALDRDAADLHAAVADLVRVYQFRDRDRICCHDISVTQCYALETLVEHGPLRLSALADRLFLDKSTTSRVVGTLVKKGYVEQGADAQDGRAIALNATRNGRSLCARITDDLVDQQKQLLQDLDPDVRAGVVRVLRRLAQAADARFRSGKACCAPSDDGCA